jgi:putative two-component system response regulator
MTRLALPAAVALTDDVVLHRAERQVVDRFMESSGYPDEHAAAVAELAILIADRLLLDAEQRRAIVLGALLHDIGKARIDERILAKPGPLDEDEWRDVQRHPDEGERLLDGMLAREVVDIVRSHHERWDGRGYPWGLAGERIPLSARIVALADAYDAITSDRPYKPGFDHQEAVRRIVADRGRHFDPVLVDAFLVCQRDFAAIRAELLDHNHSVEAVAS